MQGSATGVWNHFITDTPIAVLDFETTGLSPGSDRVVEVSVVRIDPGSQPRLVFDTLINPDRRMAASEVHGITDGDVADAPRFHDIAGELVHALSECVIAAHNVYFDLRFLRFELDRLGLYREIPHLCTMYIRPLLGRKACNLNDACTADEIAYTPTHTSRTDCTATAMLWMQYRDAFRDRQISTFRDLTLTGRKYKFFSSFGCHVIEPTGHKTSSATLKPRN